MSSALPEGPVSCPLPSYRERKEKSHRLFPSTDGWQVQLAPLNWVRRLGYGKDRVCIKVARQRKVAPRPKTILYAVARVFKPEWGGQNGRFFRNFCQVGSFLGRPYGRGGQ